MKKLLLILFVSVTLLSCTKSSYKVTNLSGKNWYSTTVYFSNSSDVNESLEDLARIGNVSMGSSASFTTKSLYFEISATDENGKLVMSKLKSLSGSTVTVTASDLY